jgi:hypothetical protein
LAAFIESNGVEKLVLDLRLNRGGNGTLLPPLVTALVKSKINKPGQFFTIIGRSTFSAAQFLVNNLERYTDTIFVGEPSGSKGNIYGDSRRIYMPNSGITIRTSVYYWQDWHPLDTREWTAPHLTAELSSEEYRTNTDPALKIIAIIFRRNQFQSCSRKRLIKMIRRSLKKDFGNTDQNRLINTAIYRMSCLL